MGCPLSNMLLILFLICIYVNMITFFIPVVITSIKCRSWSIGFARCCFPWSRSAKIWRATDPDPRIKYQPKTVKKKLFFSRNPNVNCDYKNFLISKWFIKEALKKRRKKTNYLTILLRKKTVNLKEMVIWIRINFF